MLRLGQIAIDIDKFDDDLFDAVPMAIKYNRLTMHVSGIFPTVECWVFGGCWTDAETFNRNGFTESWITINRKSPSSKKMILLS